MSAAKEALGLNKGEFTKKLGNVVDAHRANTKIIGKPRDFVLTACRLSSRFSKMANEPNVEVRLRNMKVGPRNVKVLHLKREDGFEQPVPRGQLTAELYPPRKTVNHARPEKKHAMAVRAAMRTAVDYQLRQFRKSVRLPAECVHTHKPIRLGIKWDVDHIGKPFVQLCDEWVEMQGLTYIDLSLKGPPNLKKFKDDKLQSHWILWHETHATLAPALSRANRSVGSGLYEANESIIGSWETQDGEGIDLNF